MGGSARNDESEDEPRASVLPESIRAPKRSLVQAVATAVVLLGLLALASFLGPAVLFGFVALVLLIALLELFQGLARRGKRVNVPFALIVGFALMLAGFSARARLVALALIATVMGAFLLALRPGRGPEPASDVAWTVLGVTWIAGGGAAAGAILSMDSGVALLIAVIVVVALQDVAAYFVGSWLGKRRLAPSISEGKSWEGSAGGLAAAVAGGLVAGALLAPLGLLAGLGLGLICGLLAPAGDLAESLFKREVGIKDSGTLVPGHGGMLDRLDAVIFCAAAALVYLRLVAA